MHTFPHFFAFYVFIFKICITETVTACWKQTGERKRDILNIYNALEQILFSEASVRGYMKSETRILDAHTYLPFYFLLENYISPHKPCTKQ